MWGLGMVILPRPTWPTSPYFTPRGFYPSHNGGGVEMGQDFSPALKERARMYLDFLDLTRPIPTLPHIDKG